MRLVELYRVDEQASEVRFDVQLFVRLVEWAREDAPDDMALHRMAEAAERLTSEHGKLTMDHYDVLVGSAKPEALGMYTGLTEPVDFDQNDGAERAAKRGR